MKIGIIGTGNMGTILIEAMIKTSIIDPNQLVITNRTIDKAYTLKKTYPSIHVEENVNILLSSSDIIFLCIKPLDIQPFIKQYKEQFTEEKIVVSITSPISVEQLESYIPSQCVRLIPSITNRALAGVSLLTFGESCSDTTMEVITRLADSFSSPIRIEEEITRVSSDIVSCGPAFFSYLTQRFIDGAVAETSITREKATELASQMLIGLGELLNQDIYTLPSLQEKVCVKGGVTGEGIKVLEANVGTMFEDLFKATHDKYDEDVTETTKQFSSQHNILDRK
ncbi:competence protein [Bacillus coahuilensis m2-6]|uniref:late competence protein ComER n=1 Tax=Bacillus coahuilensis TaxID=408580 RepID=UPI00075059CE|nr:late competence protein ComER [Bacillus coahuilensis]KUP07258.1 competence protein [Bacillus coahuilensis m2-6]